MVKSQIPKPKSQEGWQGWDEYAPFYDWENTRTLGRRDVAFWRTLCLQSRGPVLELGCGTGRISLPLGRAGVQVVGIDRSEPMLARARQRIRRAKLTDAVRLVRGDIRHLPFLAGPKGPALRSVGGRRAGSFPSTSLSDPEQRRGFGPAGAHGPFALVLAPYGVLQSLLRERDLTATLQAVSAALEPGATFGLELVADLPSWKEYRKRVSLTGWRHRAGGTRVTLVETVRQDPRRKLTIFDQEFTERRGRATRTHTFALAFRTLTVPQMARRLRAAGFEVTALLGDYRGGPWDKRAEVWVILARKA